MLVSPRLLPLHLLAAVAVTTAALLGLWQLGAWQAHRAAAAEDLTSLAPVPLDDVLDADDPFPAAGVGRPVQVRGEWLPTSTFLVTDRDLGGREGYWAVTALAVCDDARDCSQAAAVLVVRGWAAATSDVPSPPRGAADLTGWLQPPEGSGRPDPDPTDDRLPEVRIADAIQRVDQDLYGAYVIAEDIVPPEDGPGLEPVTPEELPSSDSSVGTRNLLYAVEWWVFGLFALFVWWRWCRDELQRPRRTTDAEPDGA